ncbi:MAG TPA: S9 family peptidase [Usitatibacter sp.]|jgi:dipeptidyl aminopeptidase/acylaminoacyl peptidase|nr:S9 family peptidase [Usitatibacter sp.]
MKRIAIALAAFAATCGWAADGGISIETFFKPSQYGAMQISPDGKHIAALAPVNGRQNLVMLDLDGKKAVPLTRLDNKDIVALFWLNNRRLLVSTGTIGTRVDDSRGGGLYAVDWDGGNERQIAEGGDEMGSQVGAVGAFHGYNYVRRLPGSDDVILEEIIFSEHKAQPAALYRVDTRTNRRTPISGQKPDSGDSENWVVDNKGVARAFVASSKGRVRIWYRTGPDAEWVKLDEFSPIKEGQWFPEAVAEDDKTLYVSSWRGRDKAAIVRYDPATKTFGDVVAAHPQVDLSNLVRSPSEILGVSYDADKSGVAWFDGKLADVQSAIDKALPDTVNTLSWSDDKTRFVITARSDVLPGAFYFFDSKTGKLEWLADRRPWIDPKKMSPMTPVRYKARDGLEIPAYLTIPKGSSGKNLPLVAVIHGGPWVSGDDWGFDPEVQFLASRGYAVLQPNYRGTTRYGWKHFSSSFRQWGGTMQDDITDGVKWLVSQGIADGARVCIYGGSYGGYATMMGLAKDPDLYKCGINYVGVTDLDLFVNATWSDFAYSPFLQNESKSMFGDPDADKALLASHSPVLLAANIKAPVFMAYGASDVRVIPDHGWRMKAALEKAGKPPQWMIAEGEGHGYRDINNQKMFYGAMEKFLDKNIGH